MYNVETGTYTGNPDGEQIDVNNPPTGGNCDYGVRFFPAVSPKDQLLEQLAKKERAELKAMIKEALCEWWEERDG